jgi:hypothetical protein
MAHPVETPRQAMLRVIAVAAGPVLMGCVQIEGGAVELSWSIRTIDGDSASCNLRSADGAVDFEDIETVRVCWESTVDDMELTGVCTAAASTKFPCVEAHGVTGFGIEPGPTALWIEPVCAGSGVPPEPDRYEVPAPIVRDITEGGVVTLNALLIAVQPDACERQ